MISVKDFLTAIDDNQLDHNEIYSILDEIKNLFKQLKDQKLIGSPESNRVNELIDSPNLDTKHALKLSIPIIPFLLSYEGELGVGLGMNLNAAWKNLKSKFKKN